MKSNNPLVSIVILNHNGKEYLVKCLNSLLKDTYPKKEIIVVDNGSIDGSQEIIKKNFPFVKLIENEKNLGFGQGNNVGIKNSRGDFILFLNNDATLSPNCIEILIKKMEKREDVGIIGCKIYFGNLNGIIQHAGGKLDVSGSGILVGYFEKDHGQYDREREVDWVHGAAFFVRKHLFKQIGLFDPIYHPIYHDEIDLCYRVRKSNYKVVYVPDAIAYHFENTEKVYKNIFFRIRNTLIFAFKYYSILKIIILPLFHIKLIINAIFSQKYQNISKYSISIIVISYIKAFVWVLRFINIIMKHRCAYKQKKYNKI